MKKIPNLVSLMDLPVTLLDCAGIEKPEDFQGRSLKVLAEGTAQNWEDCVFLQISESEVGRAIRTSRWKYCVVAKEDPWNCSGADIYYEKYLYDLEKDPCENENLIKFPGYEGVKKELRDKLKEYMKKAGEAVPEIRSWQEA